MKTRTEAQLAGDRKRCLNGVCRMTPEERRARKRKYMDDVMANPFRRQQYAAYFRKRRKRPGMRERTNAINRKAYHKDIEKSRAYGREKYARTMADPSKRAALNARRRANRKRTNAARRDQIRNRLIPLWERVVFQGREEKYLRRTTPENARLFRLWRNNATLFEQMVNAKTERR